jgi:hypothetical protein
MRLSSWTSPRRDRREHLLIQYEIKGTGKNYDYLPDSLLT